MFLFLSNERSRNSKAIGGPGAVFKQMRKCEKKEKKYQWPCVSFTKQSNDCGVFNPWNELSRFMCLNINK